MDLERTLTSRDTINSQLRGVLDEATGKWGLRVNRVEIKAIDPPKSIKDAMEKQMRVSRLNTYRARIASTFWHANPP
jgi:regulator of protease activity HflC (stomatin/prohibitin superfamily)